MAITGRPRPLPECSECKAPTRRQVWTLNGRKCNGCATPADRMRAEHQRQARLRAAQGNGRGSRSTDERIAKLAAKRADRAAAEALR